MIWKCVILLFATVCFVTPEHPNNFSSNAEVTRIKREDDYEYKDYGSVEVPKSKILLFTIVLWTSVILIVVQTLVTIYGPHLPDHPLRWHTLNYSCWNCFQLIVFANCVEESEFKTFLYNSYLTENCEPIQKMTLTVYYQSMFAVAPIEILMYFVPESKGWPITKYYFWIPFMAALDFGLVLTYCSEPWGWWSNGYAPIDTYQACITVFNFVFVVILFVITICLIVKFCYYCCQYNARPDAQLWKVNSII
uniref:Uncharacterized protein n=1 Tax=Panagrolaimus superbus TaxID=310955 RepID=A0A914Y275_9BILA